MSRPLFARLALAVVALAAASLRSPPARATLRLGVGAGVVHVREADTDTAPILSVSGELALARGRWAVAPGLEVGLRGGTSMFLATGAASLCVERRQGPLTFGLGLGAMQLAVEDAGRWNLVTGGAALGRARVRAWPDLELGLSFTHAVLGDALYFATTVEFVWTP